MSNEGLMSWLDFVTDIDLGKVCILNKNSIYNLYTQAGFLFAEDGLRTFLRALKIPYGFFVKQPPDVQRSIMSAAVCEVPDLGMWVLTNTGATIDYCEPRLEEEFMPHSDLFSNGNWNSRIVHYKSGRREYNIVMDSSNDNFHPTFFIDAPIFSGTFKINYGLYHILLGMGLQDKVINPIFVGQSKKNNVGHILQLAIDKFNLHASTYTHFLEWLKYAEFSLEEAYEFVKTLINFAAPKRLQKKIERYLDMITNDSITDEESDVPASIKSISDLVKICCNEALNMGSFSAIRAAEAVLFQAFYSLYNNQKEE